MRVLNKRTDDIPLDAIYVGRPGKWGNPFKIGSTLNKVGEICTREKSIRLYRFRLETMEAIGKAMPLEELRGKDLVCWCAPLPCHADILLELANEVKG